MDVGRVARLAAQWRTRYLSTGEIIWAEQTIQVPMADTAEPHKRRLLA
ncbi:hypothetical protein [Streptomyces sp. NBC_00996]|nr:hypothetical protein OG390_45560 [Streptomyces sp. NBC_00996]